MHLLTWPKKQTLTSALGERWTAVLSPGLLTLTPEGGGPGMTFTDPGELRAFAMQAHAAAVDRDLAVQAAAAKESWTSVRSQNRRGEPTGLRHRPFTEAPEPPLHAEVPA